ncbi:hypothetical protein WA026_016902 [Henosepilachna vigintioctopunctata]|uniref:Uncharacterized protein n=1 Tax=Henosepilachna vigintioctopunctata TaxID=420089 RepID=A0AAW1UAU1_9CUCU
MSHNGSRKDSSQSESSTSSSNQGLVIFQSDSKPKTKNELVLFGSLAPILLSRTGTVRRANSFRRDSTKSVSNEDIVLMKGDKMNEHISTPERYRRSLDSTYRHSLESISEYKAKSSFSSCSFLASRECHSMDSPYSDCTDYATRSATEINKRDDRPLVTPETNYLSWIESVQSEYFGANGNTDSSDAENKVGEWNNFWLNYQNSRSGYVSSVYYNSVSRYSQDDKTTDEFSDAKSTCSTHNFTDKNFSETLTLSIEDANEILKCSMRITEIMQNVLKKNTDTTDFSRNGSIPSSFVSNQNSIKDDIQRERSFSYTSNTELLKQKLGFKPTAPPQQSTSSSCINAILNTGVAHYLKGVMNKRRESMEPPENVSSASRHSFSEWSSN